MLRQYTLLVAVMVIAHVSSQCHYRSFHLAEKIFGSCPSFADLSPRVPANYRIAAGNFPCGTCVKVESQGKHVFALIVDSHLSPVLDLHIELIKELLGSTDPGLLINGAPFCSAHAVELEMCAYQVPSVVINSTDCNMTSAFSPGIVSVASPASIVHGQHSPLVDALANVLHVASSRIGATLFSAPIEAQVAPTAVAQPIIEQPLSSIVSPAVEPCELPANNIPLGGDGGPQYHAPELTPPQQHAWQQHAPEGPMNGQLLPNNVNWGARPHWLPPQMPHEAPYQGMPPHMNNNFGGPQMQFNGVHPGLQHGQQMHNNFGVPQRQYRQEAVHGQQMHNSFGMHQNFPAQMNNQFPGNQMPNSAQQMHGQGEGYRGPTTSQNLRKKTTIRVY